MSDTKDPTQLGLFDRAPFQRHSSTSIAAARSMDIHLPNLQSKVRSIIAEYGPITDEEIIDMSGLSPSTARPRRVELVQKGIIIDSGMKKVTRSGRKAVAWDINRGK